MGESRAFRIEHGPPPDLDRVARELTSLRSRLEVTARRAGDLEERLARMEP